jgi:endo-1,4-beta-D-glucanase Y
VSYTRRRFIATTATLLGATLAAASLQGHAAVSDSDTNCANWPAWQADGRVVDVTAGGYTTSEGQAYALFFALIADDRESFDAILTWIRNNLCGGDLTSRLMAWKWGERANQTWGVIDEHAASDADLWLAYTLFQAAGYWRDEQLKAQAELVQLRIAKELVVQVEGVGAVLLPSPEGYALATGGYKLNPSYLPLQILQSLAHQAPTEPWRDLVKTTMRMMTETTPSCIVADWVQVKPKQGFVLMSGESSFGAYEAIRVYLWAGMLSAKDVNRGILLQRLSGMHAAIKRDFYPAEKIDVQSGKINVAGPVGFSAAMLPILSAWGDTQSVHVQQTRIIALGGIPKIYYEQALALFAQGWMEHRYRFESDGSLVVKQVAKCTK